MGGRKPTSIQSLFDNSSPEPNSGCHIWMGAIGPDGRYGIASYLNETYRVHRLSYLLNKGLFPVRSRVLHKCDVPLCINPDHLFLGTDQDNMDDKVKKNRQAVGEQCNHPHRIFTEDSVKELRKLRDIGYPIMGLAKRYGCSKGSVLNIVHRKTWRHVE